jgi:hypothetical protein
MRDKIQGDRSEKGRRLEYQLTREERKKNRLPRDRGGETGRGMRDREREEVIQRERERNVINRKKSCRVKKTGRLIT